MLFPQRLFKIQNQASEDTLCFSASHWKHKRKTSIYLQFPPRQNLFDALKKRSETCTKNADLFRTNLFRTSIHPTLGPKLAQANGSMSNRVKWSKASSETRRINENVSSLIQSCSMYMFKLSNPTTSGPAQDDQRPPQRKVKSRTSKWTKHESTENWMCKHAQTWVVWCWDMLSAFRGRFSNQTTSDGFCVCNFRHTEDVLLEQCSNGMWRQPGLWLHHAFLRDL